VGGYQARGGAPDLGITAGKAGDATNGFGGTGVSRTAAGVGAAAGRAGAGGASGKGGDRGTATAGSTGDAGGAAFPSQITVWLAGDSTVAKGSTPCPVGWGVSFASYFKDTVKVVNSAVGGRSVRTWLYNVGTTMDSTGECALAKDASGNPTVQARWQAMLDGMQEGDYLFIQFGINDSSPTCDRHVGLDAFKTSYGMMAQAAKDRGARPVFITPVSMIACSGSTARGSRGAYVTTTVEAGTTNDVPVIDLHQLSVDLYNRLQFCPIPGGDVSATTSGPVGDFFCNDHTHFSPQGAPQIAALVVQAIRDQNLALAAYLK
jgi:lysophospholipase L1-like esterase